MKRTSLSAKSPLLKKPLRDKRGGAISLQSQDPRMKPLKQFGGSLLKKSNPKVARTLSTKHAMHLVLKSSMAVGKYSMRSAKNQKLVAQLLRKVAQQYGIRIVEFANMGNHLQLLIQLPQRQAFAPFIRSITGGIAQKITGATKINSIKKIMNDSTHAELEKFWDFRPWSRLVETKKTYRLATDVLIHMYLESIAMITARSRDYHRHFKETPT